MRECLSTRMALDFFAVGQISGKLGVAAFSTFPVLNASPNSVAPGDSIAAQGFGFGAGELVDVYLDAPRLLLGTTTANELGSFSGQRAISVAVPGGTSSSSSHFAYSFLPLESVYSLPSFAYMGAELIIAGGQGNHTAIVPYGSLCRVGSRSH